MAISVASTATATSTGSTDLTITKPTGLAVGDLMLFAGSVFGNFDINTKSGWTSIQTGSCANGFTNVQYKIAESADVAASNFTFSASTSNSEMAGGIMRVTGASKVNPASTSETDTNNAASGTTITFTRTVTPLYNGSLFLLLFATNESSGGAASMSGYFATGGGITFTELFDYGPEIGGIGDPTLAAAYGIQATLAAVTAYGAVTTDARDNQSGIIVIIDPSADATGTNTLVTATGAAFTQSGIADGTTSNTLATATAETFTQGGTGTSPTTWTNEPTTTTTWTNDQL